MLLLGGDCLLDGGTAVERNFPMGAIKSKFNKHIQARICNYEFKAGLYLFLSKRTVSSIGYISFITVVMYAFISTLALLSKKKNIFLCNISH